MKRDPLKMPIPGLQGGIYASLEAFVGWSYAMANWIVESDDQN
jgi:hypothetical protein